MKNKNKKGNKRKNIINKNNEKMMKKVKQNLKAMRKTTLRYEINWVVVERIESKNGIETGLYGAVNSIYFPIIQMALYFYYNL